MKQYTTTEQTAKLIELGFEKPKNRVDGEIEEILKVIAPLGEFEMSFSNNRLAYTIGELIEILDGKVTLEIDNDGGIWLVSTPIFDFIGAELIDCLFDACVKLKEEGVI